jgi:hypothetical protein
MKRLLLTLFSIGWLVPAWLGFSLLFGFLELDVVPLLSGRHSLNSFPHLAFSSRCFGVAFLWLAAVAVFWSWQLSGRALDRATTSTSSTPRRAD